MDAFEDSLVQNNDFQLHDFIDDANFDQFINIIRGENEDPVPSFDCQLISAYCNDNQLIGSTNQEDMFDFNGVSNTMVADLSSVLNSSVSSLNGDINNEGDPEEDDDEDDSSGTTKTKITTTSAKKSKVDRTRTLISERKRRVRMKEKLYALRALVPNITKMDKASIIGDAVLYLQELQTQANKLKAEIAGLEASLAGAEKYQQSIDNKKKTQVRSNSQPVAKKIMQMDVVQVEERGFYLKLVSNRGAGVAISLYKALESLTSFNVQNSNLATLSERYVLTLTLHVRDGEQSMHLPNLKLWVISALLNQGFQVLTSNLSA